MKFNNTENPSYKIDGKEIWASRSVAVNCVIVAVNPFNKNDPYVLISQRGPGAADFHGMWNVVAGYLDYDETTTDACIREAFEETNVNIPQILKEGEVIRDFVTTEWGTNSDPVNNRQNVSFRFGLYFKMDGLKEKIKLSNKNSEPDEVADIKWICISELKHNYTFAFNHDRLIMEFVNKYVIVSWKRRILLFLINLLKK